MTRKQKLELTWVGKDERPRLEPRILLEDPALSHHASKRVSDKDRFDNILIQGDNLLALKALEQEFTGKVKCVFIDPPYNTGSAFEHYDDGIEHSLWLSMMRDRLALISRLLTSDGSLWITIDDNESHYLKVLCDECFGRENFVANVIWQKSPTRENRTDVSTVHDNVLVFARDRRIWKTQRNPLPASDEQLARYVNPDDDPRGPWASLPAHGKAEKGRRQSQFFTVTTPSGRSVTPPPGRCWLYTQPRFDELVLDNRIWFGADGSNVPRVKKFRSEVQAGLVPSTLWPYNEVGSNAEARAETTTLFPEVTPFSTPKPERLLSRILQISTNPGDLVLDSFLGSGTTAAVAHKMGRRWIGIEMGDHAITHCAPRLRMVVDAQDPGGITRTSNWRGGGGFRFYRLAPSLLQKDTWGNWVINRQYNAEMLAEAVCKLEGFRYAPNAEVFWQHGHATESDFLYVTTQTLTATQLEWISEQVGPERSLLILASAFVSSGAVWPNLTLKKLPNTVLGRCEFGKDDYSMQVAALPDADPFPTDDVDSDAAPAATRRVAKRARRRTADPSQESLLDSESVE